MGKKGTKNVNFCKNKDTFSMNFVVIIMPFFFILPK